MFAGKKSKTFKWLLITALLLVVFPAMLNAAEWAAYTYYEKGVVVTYQGTSYTCRMSHTSLPGWEPPNVLALWLPGGTVSTSTPAVTIPATATPTNTPTFTNTGTPPANSPTPTTPANLTDITNQGGTITAQYYDSPSGEEIDKLIDNSSSTKYLTFHASGWVQFQANASYMVTQYTITSANDAAERDPYTWTFQGSTNGSTWVTLDSRSGEDFANRFQKNTYSFANTSSYNYYRLNMTNNSGTILQLAEWEIFSTNVMQNTATPTRSSTPTPTTPVANGFPVPGKIEAEDYDAMSGIQTEATTDTGGGSNVGWIEAGDWMEYNVNVSYTGNYTAEYRVASLSTVASMSLLFDGVNKGTVSIPVTGGWQTWTTVSHVVSLNSGNHTIRLSAGTSGFNVNWMNFTYGAVNTSTPTPTSAPTPTPNSGTSNYEILIWIAAYNLNTCMTNLESSYGGAWNPRNTLSMIGGQFFLVNTDGSLSMNISSSDMTRVKNYCSANGIKFFLTIFNYDTSWNWSRAVSAFANNRTAHVNNLVNIAQQYGADGIDIDYEGNLAGDPNRAEFNTFIRELAGRLHSIGKELSVDTFPYIWNQPNVNWWADWAGYVDQINSMGYGELYGGGTSYSAYNYQLTTVTSAGYRNDQVALGMPGWLASWGSGGLGTSPLAHIQEVLDTRYASRPMSICIWDAAYVSAWANAQVWEALHNVRVAN
ncbi:MAG: carbohydrate-binding protein [Spirochaetales bacterium]|nr:carbohydrate-binding protein [Spirochaetales bacterium]